MKPETYRIQGYVLIAAGILTLMPTIREIRMFGFDNGMILPLLCAVAICLSSTFNFRNARKLEREQKTKKGQ